MPHSGQKKGKGKARLTNRERGLIVSMLATWNDPQEIVEALGRDVPRQTIQAYDAAKPRNRARLSGKWITLFDDTRRAFLDNVEDVAISHKAFRLRELDGLYRKVQAAKQESPHRVDLDIGVSYDFIEIELRPDDELPKA